MLTGSRLRSSLRNSRAVRLGDAIVISSEGTVVRGGSRRRGEHPVGEATFPRRLCVSLIAEFPNQAPVVLAGLAVIASAKTDG